jgi:hypothetical protein
VARWAAIKFKQREYSDFMRDPREFPCRRIMKCRIESVAIETEQVRAQRRLKRIGPERQFGQRGGYVSLAASRFEVREKDIQRLSPQAFDPVRRPIALPVETILRDPQTGHHIAPRFLETPLDRIARRRINRVAGNDLHAPFRGFRSE